MKRSRSTLDVGTPYLFNSPLSQPLSPIISSRFSIYNPKNSTKYVPKFFFNLYECPSVNFQYQLQTHYGMSNMTILLKVHDTKILDLETKIFQKRSTC